jgi:hypothetical protein
LSAKDDHTEKTNLSYHKCENCPLDDKIIKKCPAALDVKEAMNHFKDVLSTDIIKTSVETENRTYLKTCDAPTAATGFVVCTSPLAELALLFCCSPEALEADALLFAEGIVNLNGAAVPSISFFNLVFRT